MVRRGTRAVGRGRSLNAVWAGSIESVHQQERRTGLLPVVRDGGSTTTFYNGITRLSGGGRGDGTDRRPPSGRMKNPKPRIEEKRKTQPRSHSSWLLSFLSLSNITE